MMKNYQNSNRGLLKNFVRRYRQMAFLGLLLPLSGLAQQSYTFTNCGATGSVGPTQGQANTSYSNTNLMGLVTVSAGIQSFTIPNTAAYRIEAYGAAGGTQSYTPGWPGGRGAFIQGDFTLTAGTVLKILVGQKGEDTRVNTEDNAAPGGGGGSFVYVIPTSSVPLIAAGGGGGGSRGPLAPNASTTTSGNAAQTGGLGGLNGNGGQANNGGSSYWAGGGSGWLTDGTGGNNATNYSYTGGSNGAGGGRTPANGGAGGVRYNDGLDEGGDGGFGGGGGGGSDNMGTGGGGGFSGGGGARTGSSPNQNAGGGGGGSYNGGANPVNTASVNTGHGRVILRELCGITLAASTPNPTLPVICVGTAVTLTTNAVSGYSWSTGNTTNTLITVTPSVTTTYSVQGTSTAACLAFSAITITVSPGLPVLAVASTTNQVCLGKSITFTASGALTYTWSNGLLNGVPFTPSATSVYTVTGGNGCGISSSTVGVTIAPLVVNISSSTPSICAGSPATMTASAAATGYTWQPITQSGSVAVVSPASTTIFTVTASDGTCSGTGTVQLLAVALPTITSASTASAICSGDTVTLTANGALSYTWSPGANSGSVITVNPTQPTLFSVTGSNAQGCTATSAQAVIVYPSPSLSITTTSQLICEGETVTLTISGADTYAWASGPTSTVIIDSPTTSTVYNVVGTTTVANCSSTASINVNVFSPVITISGNTVICDGATANLLASGADTYTWSNNVPVASNPVAPSITTIYTVSATTASGNINCPSSTSVQVLVNPNPTVTATANRTVMCKGESNVLTASGASTYSWNTSANTASTTITPSLVTTLNITVIGTDANGCVNSTTVQVKVNGCQGIASNAENKVLTVYPNPTAGDINFSFDADIDLNIVNELGQVVRVVKLNSANNHKATVSGLSNGIYFATGVIGNQKINEKIIVIH
ncbi:MAG: T9SS type A sorting domain-containing protein [Bacteroidia bacterium]|nr:T9SS type A sorting domain-containing protein [Bacteroidia bacterium]